MDEKKPRSARWEGWIKLTNDREVEIMLYIEPWGTGYIMPPKVPFYVYVVNNWDPLPEIVYQYDSIQLFVSDFVIYRRGELLWHQSNVPVPRPPFDLE
jgi:hypothetical protein